MPRAIVVLACALCLASTAGADEGGIWFDTASATTANLEQRYDTIVVAQCEPVPATQRVRYHAHTDGTGRWDAFLCSIRPQVGVRCNSIAHITGREWWQFSLGSYAVDSCTPAQLGVISAGPGRRKFVNAQIDVTFAYPERFTYLPKVDFSKTAGSSAYASVGFFLTPTSAITLSLYRMGFSITDANLARHKAEIDTVVGQLATGPVTATRVRYGGLPGYAYRLDVDTPPQGQSRVIVLFRGRSEYFFNCQSTPSRRRAVEAACRVVLATLQKA